MRGKSAVSLVIMLGLLTGVASIGVADKAVTVGVIRDPITERYATPGVEPYLTGIYEPLVFVGSDMSLQPGLATSWERIDDLTWRFYLRQGVTFHNGKDFNATTVKFSLEWILEHILWSVRLRIDDVQVVDEYTIDVITEVPLAVLPGFMSHGWTVMSEPESMAAGQVVGTGPFKYESSIPGERLDLVKNESYWQDGYPLIDRLRFRVMPDETSRTMALLGGEVDIALQIPYPSVAMLEQAGFTLFKSLTSQWAKLHFCQYVEPLDDLRVRQAVMHAIDRDVIADEVLYGFGVVANSPVLPTTPWSGEDRIEGFAYDPDRARALLADAGWEEVPGGPRRKDGEELHVTLRMIDDPSVLISGREMASVMAEQLAEVGFRVSIRVEETSLFYDQHAANLEGDLYLDYSGTFSGELSATLFDGYQPNREVYTEATPLYGDFIPPVVGEWLAAIQTSTVDAEREDYLVKMAHLVGRDMVLSMPFMYYLNIVGAADYIEGYEAHPLFFWPGVWTRVNVTR